MKIAHLIGDPIEVDPISLIRTGPVRVKVACRDASLIRGGNEVFFNYEGRNIKWVAETTKNVNNPPPQPSKFDRFRKEDEEDEYDDASQGSHDPRTQRKDEVKTGNKVVGELERNAGSQQGGQAGQKKGQARDRRKQGGEGRQSERGLRTSGF